MKEMKNIRLEREDEESATVINGILNAPDLTYEEYSDKIKHKDEFLEDTDLYAIKRYNIVKCYHINKKLDIKNEQTKLLEETNKEETDDEEPNEELKEDKESDKDNDDEANEANEESDEANEESDEAEEESDEEEIKESDKEKAFNLKDLITVDFLEEYNDKIKMKWYRNITTILNTNNLTTQQKIDILKCNAQIESNAKLTSCYLDFTSKNKYIYHYYAIEVINTCGFDINDLSIIISQDDLEMPLCGCLEWIESNKFDIANKFEIKIINKKITSIEKIHEKLRVVNSIIYSQYGMKIKGTKVKNNITYKLTDDDMWNNIGGIIPVNVVNKLDQQENYKFAEPSYNDEFAD